MKLMPILAIVSLGASLALAEQSSSTFAQKSADGKSLVVPQAHSSKGTVYYAITDRDRQIYFESDAPLEDIKGQSNDVVGYAVVSSGNTGAIVAGEWHLPVDSMKTGIELRDEHLASSAWLDAASYPDVVVQVREIKSLKETKRTAAFSSSTMTLVVDLTLHGETKTISIPDSSVILMKASDATSKVAKGDLMAIRTKFTVTLADFGVTHPVIGEKVAKEVSLDVALYLSTLPPNQQ